MRAFFGFLGDLYYIGVFGLLAMWKNHLNREYYIRENASLSMQEFYHCKYAKTSPDKVKKCIHHQKIFCACYNVDLKIDGIKMFTKKNKYLNVSFDICKECKLKDIELKVNNEKEYWKNTT